MRYTKRRCSSPPGDLRTPPPRGPLHRSEGKKGGQRKTRNNTTGVEVVEVEVVVVEEEVEVVVAEVEVEVYSSI